MARVNGRTVRGVMAWLAVGAGVLAGGCNTLPPDNGPTLGVRNDSDAPLRATFWIGDRTSQRPGGRADMNPQETLEIPAFGTKQFRLGAFSGYQSPTESFVRVQIQPVGPSFQASSQHWFELNPPSPYTIRVWGRKPKLEFERAGGGTMVAVPSELWFRNAITPTTATATANAGGPATLRPSSSGTVQAAAKYKKPQAVAAPARPGAVAGVPDAAARGNE